MLSFISSEDCFRCKKCCRFYRGYESYAPLFDEKLKSFFVISGIIGENSFKKVCKNAWQLQLKRKAGKNSMCDFLGEENKCRIYNKRNLDCKLYPFSMMRKKGKVFLAVDRECPVIANKFKAQSFEKYADYIKNYLNKNKKMILRKNPRIVEGFQKELTIVSELKWKE